MTMMRSSQAFEFETGIIPDARLVFFRYDEQIATVRLVVLPDMAEKIGEALIEAAKKARALSPGNSEVH